MALPIFGVIFRGAVFFGVILLIYQGMPQNTQTMARTTIEELGYFLIGGVTMIFLGWKIFRPSRNVLNRRRWGWAGIVVLGAAALFAAGLILFVAIREGWLKSMVPK